MGRMSLILTVGRFWEWPNAKSNENTVGVREEFIETGPCVLFNRSIEPRAGFVYYLDIQEPPGIVVRMCEIFQWGIRQ